MDIIHQGTDQLDKVSILSCCWPPGAENWVTTDMTE